MNEKSYSEGVKLAKEAIAIWNSLSENQKIQIKKKVDLHHGEIGIPIAVLGRVLSLSKDKKIRDLGEIFAGFGDTLIIDDIQDIDKWFRSRERKD
jgi:hypothetical protein